MTTNIEIYINGEKVKDIQRTLIPLKGWKQVATIGKQNDNDSETLTAIERDGRWVVDLLTK